MTSITEYSVKQERCPECYSKIILIEEKGETVCSHCGLIIYERQFDLSHKGIRIYNKDGKAKKDRLGGLISPLIPDIALCTYIDKNYIYNSELKRAVRRDSNLTWKSRNLLIASNELKRIGSNLNLPGFILEEAFSLYKLAFKANILKGRSIIGMITACIYYSCKNKKIPRTFQEILNQTPMVDKIVKKCYIILVRELKLKVVNTNPLLFIPRFAAELNLGFDIEIVAWRILQPMIKKKGFCGKDPKGFCAGALYFACKTKNLGISQKEIAKVVGVTEVTLRSRYKECVQNIKLITSKNPWKKTV